jgi:hypothetical protein
MKTLKLFFSQQQKESHLMIQKIKFKKYFLFSTVIAQVVNKSLNSIQVVILL